MKKQKPKSLTVAVNLRMDAKLHRALRMMAAARGVTMTAIIVGALKAKGIK